MIINKRGAPGVTISLIHVTIHITDRLGAGGFREVIYPHPGTVADLHRVLHQLGASSLNLVKTKIYFIYINSSTSTEALRWYLQTLVSIKLISTSDLVSDHI